MLLFRLDLVPVLTFFALPVTNPIRRAVIMALICPLCGCSLFTTPPRVGLVTDMVPALPDHCGATPLLPLVGQPFTALANHPYLAESRAVWPEQEVTSVLSGRRNNAVFENGGIILRRFGG